MVILAAAGAPTPAGAPGGPWAFHVHVIAVGVVAVVGGLYAWAVRRQGRAGGPGALPTRRQRWWLAGALATLAVALTWPLADLAAHWSLTALLVQRLLLTLVVAPMLLLAMPTPLLAAITRPAPVDAALDLVTRPVVAIVAFS